jgi:hypothetical protein
MKKLILLFSLFQAIALNAQVLRYNFNNTLNEQNGNGPALTVLGNAGVYQTDLVDSVNNITKTVYRFEKNSGLQFNNAAAGNFLGNAYTIELFFVFDELSSWKRVVDWKNRKSDGGAYVFNGQLNFYPFVYSGTAPVKAGKYSYYVVTRDNAGNVLVYTDGNEFISFSDAGNAAVLDTANVLNFFQDDLIVQNEASAGAVAKINLYNCAIDSVTVKNTFENLDDLLLSVADVVAEDIKVAVFPNPTNDKITVVLNHTAADKNYEITITNTQGAMVYSNNHDTANTFININTAEFPDGLYMVNVRNGNTLVSKRILVIH